MLLAHVRSGFALSNSTYGRPRMTRELQAEGFAIGRRRTAWLMLENDPKPWQKRRFKRTTDSLRPWPVAPNIIDQHFAAAGPDQKWGADISYVVPVAATQLCWRSPRVTEAKCRSSFKP